MKIVSQNKRSDDYSDDFIYQFESLKSPDEIKAVLYQLKNSNYDILGARISYNNDHSSYTPDNKFDNIDEFLAFYDGVSFQEVGQLGFDSVVMGRRATILIYPNTNVLAVYVQKKNIEIQENHHEK